MTDLRTIDLTELAGVTGGWGGLKGWAQALLVAGSFAVSQPAGATQDSILRPGNAPIVQQIATGT